MWWNLMYTEKLKWLKSLQDYFVRWHNIVLCQKNAWRIQQMKNNKELGLTQKHRLHFRFSQNRLEDSHQRIGQLVFQIILRVDRNVVFQHVDRILSFCVSSDSFGRSGDYIRYAVAKLWCRACVPLPHLVCQLDVSLREKNNSCIIS